MPFKNPFFFSKRAIEKFKRVQEQQEVEAKAPASVNNFKTSNKSTFGQSKNIHVPKKKEEAAEKPTKPAEINNFEVNNPTMAKSLNQYPAETIKPRNVKDVVPAVNGKAAPHLVHKPEPQVREQDYFPVVEKKEKKKTVRKRSRKKTT